MNIEILCELFDCADTQWSDNETARRRRRCGVQHDVGSIFETVISFGALLSAALAGRGMLNSRMLSSFSFSFYYLRIYKLVLI